MNTLVSVVVPVYQNAASLEALVTELSALAGRNSGYAFEFVLVDDGSTDGSFDVLERLCGLDDRIHLVKLSRNFGSNAAIQAGMEVANGAAVAVISADLQDPPALLDEMIRTWSKGKKVVLAVRARRHDPFLTSLFARVFYALFRRLAIPTMPRGGFDFFLVDRQVVDLINTIEERNAYLVGLILWLGFDPVKLEYDRAPRDARFGRSTWTTRKKIKYFADSFVAFSYFPLRMASALGILLGAMGFLYAAFVVTARIVGKVAAPGYASLMVVVLVVSGVQLFMIGILGEYIWRGLEESRQRPRYVVDRVSRGRPSVDDTVAARGRPRRTRRG